MTARWLESSWARVTSHFDVRPGEGRVALGQFAVLLLAVITGHTILETARDALLLTGPGPRALGAVYIGIAACTLPSATLVSYSTRRFGARRTLTSSLLAAMVAACVLYALPAAPQSAMAVYVISGVIGSIIVPQFWMLAGSALTVAQGRRLYGLISAAGVLGGVLGSGVAASVISIFPARSLLLLSAAVFASAAALAQRVQGARSTRPPRAGDRKRALASAFRDEPYLVHVASIVFLSTATLLAIDYDFKATMTRALPPAQVGPSIARYYLLLNVASLCVQIFFGSSVVQRLGVTAAFALTPGLLLLGAAGVLVSGGSLAALLVLKGIDGSLRYSLHRITGELTYLPLSPASRERVKPMIDGALGRAAQTVTGGAFLLLARTPLLSPRHLAVFVTCGVAAWLIGAIRIRRPYLALLRRAVSSGSIGVDEHADAIDLETAEFLVQRLGSEDPFEVLAAIDALARRRQTGLIPALVLLLADDAVLTRALELFAASERRDWIPLARRALHHASVRVRLAAARALAKHDSLRGDELENDSGLLLRGYAAVTSALRAGRDPAANPFVAALRRDEQAGTPSASLGMLAAICDAPPSSNVRRLLAGLAETAASSVEGIKLLAQAAASQRDVDQIPLLVSFLPIRSTREAVRAALQQLGEPALEQVSAALRDRAGPQRLRIHLPKTLVRFGTERVGDLLLDCIETDGDALVRYKAIQALDVLVSRQGVAVDASRAERLCEVNLHAHFKLLALRTVLARADADPKSAPGRLLFGLIDDKLRHSVERAFRLLKVAYPREDIHGVHLACTSDDRFARASAGELLDALLRRGDQQRLRELLRLVADDLSPDDRVRRYAAIARTELAKSPKEALAALDGARDAMLAALAKQYEAAQRAPEEREEGLSFARAAGMVQSGGVDG